MRAILVQEEVSSQGYNLVHIEAVFVSCQAELKGLTKLLGHVGRVKLPGGGPIDEASA